ncbi:endonuclease V [Mesonia aestuariivivens]|uniref:Endonuclease V n=1 Tax=Mesonia aestuariivivens TaxID=2796128 RepID=A0ABS6VYG0_9FLAO|nr:endonuclease V [Mesonia aestuariivivens]MBW2960544.1 endonuclease V [Mesonia aestuariivivens]
MILAFDTYYYDTKAKTIAVSFNDWQDEEPLHIYSEIIEGVSDYESGAFYKRELPCILSLLNKINIEEINAIIIDGYTMLEENKLGLGGHLYEKFDQKIPIIGVAKSQYQSNTSNYKTLLRGGSVRPLYISAIGIDLKEAYNHIKTMHGDFRMPTLLQLVDTKTKEKNN